MGKLIDLQNKKFGDLIVIERGPNTSDNKAQWFCQCDCGNIILRTSKTLRNGATNCGCKKRTTVKNLIGQKFGRLTVIERHGSDKNNKATWDCLCDCGKQVVIRGSDLISGKIKSCGCLKTELLSENLTGKTFGRLTVICPTEQRISGNIAWQCKCECGNICIVSTNHLITGNTQSCGCLSSKGEQIIAEYLQEQKISYATQYTFSDLLGKKECPLRFDFAIFFNNTLIGLVEYQGMQHYYNTYGLSDEEWVYSLERDNKKREYCKQNNISLLEIKYNENCLEKLGEWLKCQLKI